MDREGAEGRVDDQGLCVVATLPLNEEETPRPRMRARQRSVLVARREKAYEQETVMKLQRIATPRQRILEWEARRLAKKIADFLLHVREHSLQPAPPEKQIQAQGSLELLEIEFVSVVSTIFELHKSATERSNLLLLQFLSRQMKKTSFLFFDLLLNHPAHWLFQIAESVRLPSPFSVPGQENFSLPSLRLSKIQMPLNRRKRGMCISIQEGNDPTLDWISNLLATRDRLMEELRSMYEDCFYWYESQLSCCINPVDLNIICPFYSEIQSHYHRKVSQSG